MPHDILIVDENTAALASLTAALESAGHRTIAALSFRDGVRIMTATTPALLICSVKLGPFNGLHLLMRGRSEHPDLPAIMIGPASEVLAREARALGAAVYLAQPIETGALLSAAAELLESADEAGPDLDVRDLPVFLEG